VALGGGSRTAPMILDTGAPTIVSGEIAEVFAGDVAGTIATTSVDGQVFTSDVVPLPQLAIGDAIFSHVGAVVGEIKPGNPFYCISEAGFIGASLMQTAVWQIDPGSDPSSGSLTIAESVDGLDHVDGAIRLDFARASDVSPSPLIKLPTGAGALTLLLDTGSDGWLAVHPDDLADAGVALPDDAPSMSVLGRGTAGPFTTRLEWSAVDVGLGDEVMRLPLAASAALPPGQGIAGVDFLSRFVVTVDWPGDAVYLDPIAEVAPSIPASASLSWDNGYVVGSYAEGLSANDGLELGADVTAIDGIDVTRAPFDDFCTRLTAEDAATYEMTVAGDVPTTVEVTRVEDFLEPLGT
ncbi:MAG: hypothetical protein U9O18_03720, partial [Chloroflexota bacterium]|nr:hypothetical protein [Chloroflexota bacterium]